jgi:hypothetical protein
MLHRVRLIAGILIWVLLAGGLVFRSTSCVSGTGDRAVRDLARFTFQRRTTVQLSFPTEYVIQIGDPIFWRDSDGVLRQVGAIRQIDSAKSKNYQAARTQWATATFFATAPPIDHSHYLKLYETPKSVQWVVDSLLPPERKQEIAALIRRIIAENSVVIVEQLKPVFLQALSDTGIVLRDELATAIAAHEEEWVALGRRYQVEIVEQELIPLVNSEVWPIVQQELKPVIQEIGAEIWSEASVWRFGWRAVYDSLPFSRSDMTRQEFNRFVEETALPIVTRYIPRILETQQRILNRVANNARVQQFVAGTFARISGDPELQDLIVQIVREAVLENERFQQQLDRIWNRADVAHALEFSDARFGPYIELIGEKLFGSPSGGVTPEFARILRHRILLKDTRWLELVSTETAPEAIASQLAERYPGQLPIILSATPRDNPFFIEARVRK